MPIKKIIKYAKYAKKIRFAAPLLILFAIIPFQAYAGSCSIWDWDTWDCVKSILTQICYWILSLVSVLVYFAGLLFDKAITIAMGDPAKQLFTDPNGIVVAGWRIVRDIANIFFIFTLLYIGISMILQLTTYGSKKILLGVIIAALLVNFSLPITRVVIDFSNVIAMEFLCKMTNNTCQARNLSSVLAQGLSFQSVFGAKNVAGLQAMNITASKILIAAPFGIIVILVAAFVIFAGAVLVLMRTVFLIILAIFSPLAFLFMALPGKAGSYANMWWDKLFSQCFFLPVYMFMLYLVVMMITPSTAYPYGQLASFAGSSQASFESLFTAEGSVQASNAGIIVQYIIMIILLLLSLAAAQQIGACGASGMIRLGGAARKKTVGYAGRGARRMAGKPAEAFVTGKAPEGAGRISRGIAAAGRGFGKAARCIPGAGLAAQGVANIAAANRAKVAEIQTGLAKNNATELKSIAAASSGFTRIAALNQLAELEKLTPGQGLSSQHIKTAPTFMKRYGMEAEAKNIEKLNWQYAETDDERNKIVQKAQPAVMKKIMEDEGLSKEYLKPEIMEEMQKSFRPEHYKAVYEANTAASHKFFGSLTEGSKSIEEMAQKLENLGTAESRRSATWATSASAGVIMETYLPSQPPPPPPKPKQPAGFNP